MHIALLHEISEDVHKWTSGLKYGAELVCMMYYM